MSVARLARQRDTESLMEWLGALALDPANAVPQLVLEALAHVVMAAGQGRGGPAATSADLRRLTARGFRLFPVALDPPEQAFAAPFLYRETSVVVPMGLVVGAAYDLERTLEVVDELAKGDPAIEALARSSEVMLRILGAVAERAGLIGVVEPAGRHDRVAGLWPERASRLREAVRLAPDDLVALAGEEWRTLMAPLTAADSPEEILWDGHDGTLSFRPFLSASDGGLLLAVPGMVLPAVDRHVRSVISGLPASNAARLREQVLWADIERSLSLLRIGREGAETEAQDEAPRRHRMFRIDEAQQLAVVLVTGSGADADTAVAEARDELVARGGEHVLTVVFAPEEGESAFFGLDKPPAGIAELLMKPEELSTFARVEAGEPRSLADFARASSAIRDDVRVFSWCALDEFAIYRQHQSSYYLSDDGQPTLITVAPGSALPVRLEAARRSEQDVVLSPTGQATVVMRRWEGHDGVWGPITSHLAQGALVVRTVPPVWVLTPPYGQIDPALIAGWRSVLDAVAYWIFEAREAIVEMLTFAKLRFAIVTVEGVETWTGQYEGDDESYVRLRIIEPENVVRIRLLRAFAELAQSPDNTADRHLLAAILEGLAKLTGYPDLGTVAPVLNAVAPAGPKKMLLLLDVSANPDVGPDDVPRWRRVRDAPVAIVLDELGVALQQRGWRPATADLARDPNRILNEAVTVLLAMLEQEVGAFGPSLLDALLLRNEAILRERAEAGFHLIPRLACFPGELADAQRRIDGLDTASVAGRFLIEFVAAQPPNGLRVPSLGAVDRLLAIADVLTLRGHASEIERLGLAQTKARMLASGRLGIDDRALSGAWHAFSTSVQLDRADEARQSFLSRWGKETKDRAAEFEALDRACLAEWEYSFTDLGRVIGAAMSLSLLAGEPVTSLPGATAVQTLAADAEVTPDTVRAILEQLTLAPREAYLNPPDGLSPTDLYPWRYNRSLSFLRRPFVRRSRGELDELVFGRRALLESLYYLLELIETSRLRPRSREMADYIGRKSVERGAAFNDRVAAELAELFGRPVRRRVTKLGRTHIADARGSLGDIDVLGVDHDHRIVWAVECKALAPSRTPREVFNELADLLGTDARPGHLGKHARLVEWLRTHRELLLAEVGVDGNGWRIEGLFVVDDDLYGPYFRATPMPVVPFRRLREFVLAAAP